MPIQSNAESIITEESCTAEEPSGSAMHRTPSALPGVSEFLDTVPSAAWILDRDGLPRHFNNAWQAYTGQSPTRDGVDEWQSTVHPDDIEDLERWHRGVPLAEGQCLLDVRLRRSDGLYRLFALTSTSPREGHLSAQLVLATDVEDRTARETDAKQAERELRKAVNWAPVAVWSCRPDGSADFINDQWLAYVGLSWDEARDGGWVAMLHPEDSPNHIGKWQISVETGTQFEVESRIIGPGGDYRWFLARANAVRDEAGNIAKWYGTNIDIHDLKETERALRRSEAFLSEAQRLSKTGSFGWNLTTGEVFWSDETYRIYGYAITTPPSIDLTLVRVHPDDRDSVQRVIEQAAVDMLDFETEHRLMMPDGSVRVLRVVARKQQVSSAWMFLGAVMDVTDVRRANDHLEKAQSELAHAGRVLTVSQMAASLGHEINQPLAAIMTNAEASLRWLNRDASNLDEVREGLASIIAGARLAREVVERIRPLIKKEAPSRQLIELSLLVEESRSLLQRGFEDSRVSVHLDLLKDVPKVRGDRVQLQQVIINIMINGLQAMTIQGDQPRQMIVRTSLEADDEVVVMIQDSGNGFNEEEQDKVFEPFYTTKPSGLGLGLSICRSIIESHSGRLWATNNDGGGATFLFSLPVARDH